MANKKKIIEEPSVDPIVDREALRKELEAENIKLDLKKRKEKINQVLRVFGLFVALFLFVVGFQLFWRGSLFGLIGIGSTAKWVAYWVEIAPTACSLLVVMMIGVNPTAANIAANIGLICWIPALLYSVIEIALFFGCIYLLSYNIKDLIDLIKNVGHGTVFITKDALDSIARENLPKETISERINKSKAKKKHTLFGKKDDEMFMPEEAVKEALTPNKSLFEETKDVPEVKKSPVKRRIRKAKPIVEEVVEPVAEVVKPAIEKEIIPAKKDVEVKYTASPEDDKLNHVSDEDLDKLLSGEIELKDIPDFVQEPEISVAPPVIAQANAVKPVSKNSAIDDAIKSRIDSDKK